MTNSPEARIAERLAAAEAEHGVRVLYACESGSRAWGFASQDSDYDARFIYVRPADWYLSINVERKRDVIEYPIVDELDINGWDLRKALGLFRKSNPPLMEWLHSPLVYRDELGLAAALRELAAAFVSPVAMHYHYLSMARGNFREFLQGDRVLRKKYLYVLRPLMAIRWLEQGRGVPPVRFDELVAAAVTEPGVLRAIDELLAEKRTGKELSTGPRIAPLSEFIDAELMRLQQQNASPGEGVETEPLNALFRQMIDAAWGPG